jgi:hypothetical protein
MQGKNKIEFVAIEKFDSELLTEAARLHIEHLSYRSFITMFGLKFMVELYKDILAAKLGFFVFAFDGKKVCGFVLGCTNSQQLFSVIKRRPFKYFAIIFPRLIINPGLISKLIETMFYVKKENSAVESELIVIVTDLNYRGEGIGSGLVSDLNKEFLKRDIHEYKVTVHDEMKMSNNFYVKNGMKLSDSFLMYGVKWNLYINKI